MKILYQSNEFILRQILHLRCNAYLLQNLNGGNILIDCGGLSQWLMLVLKLKKLGIKKIDYLVLTHAHFDHCANTRFIQKKFRAKVIVHKNEANFLLNGFGTLPQSHYPFRNFATKYLNKHARIFFKYPKTKPDITFSSSYILKGYNCEILHTPGHSPGSSTIIINHNLAIVGDLMVHIKPRRIFPAFANNIAKILDNWRELSTMNIGIFYPGHGKQINIATLNYGIKQYSNRFFGSNANGAK